MELDKEMDILSVEEKTSHSKNNYCITAVYFYPKDVSEMTKEVKPSKRGELEITMLNVMYLKDGRLMVQILGQGFNSST